MFAKVKTAGLLGMDGYPVEVEADVQNGLPGFYLTGALSTETREARSRVWNALKNSGIQISPRKITVNFSPASRRKDGTAYDLPIAAAVLTALGLIPGNCLEDTAFFGELGLDGSLKGVRGALCLSYSLRNLGIRRLIVPHTNSREAALAPGIEVIGCGTLTEVVECIRRDFAPEVLSILNEYSAVRKNSFSEDTAASGHAAGKSIPDFSDVCGQDYLKRAAEIAASGKHNFLMSGVAGSGKTMIAKRIPGILPELTTEEKIRISKLYSLLGLLPEGNPLISERPFRDPHHSISTAAFAGGGSLILPGELSLASDGILFLDEIALFSHSTLETLRTPLEERMITVTRSRGSCTYPADFMLVAAMNFGTMGSIQCNFWGAEKLCQSRCTPIVKPVHFNFGTTALIQPNTLVAA